MTLLIVLSLIAVGMVAMAGRVLFVEYPRSAVDATRNQLFEIRDELFDLARSGAVKFDHPGYVAARDLINGMIRYAHDVSAIHLLFANVMANHSAKRLRKAVNASIRHDLNSLPKSAKEPVDLILAKASLALARLVIFRSVGLSSLFAMYAAFHGLTTICVHLKSSLGRLQHVGTESAGAHSERRNNVEESMQEVIDHGPMRKVPRLVAREAGRYARRFELDMLPQAA